MKNLIRLSAILTLTLWLSLTASNAFGQTDPCPQMPSGYLCLPRAVAVKALEDADARKALEAELKVRDQADQDIRKALEDMRIEFARVSGELTGLKQQAVRDAAIIEMLLQNVKKKRNAFITIF